MHAIKFYIPVALVVSALTLQTAFAQHEHHHETEGAKSTSTKLKPYSLKTCIVSGEKLGGDMGKPYVHEYKGREIKFCCKNCLKDFNKDPQGYVRKIEQAEKK